MFQSLNEFVMLSYVHVVCVRVSHILSSFTDSLICMTVPFVVLLYKFYLLLVKRIAWLCVVGVCREQDYNGQIYGLVIHISIFMR